MLGLLFIVLAGILWALDTLIRYPLLNTGFSAEKIVFFEHFFLCLIFIPLLFKKIKNFGEIKFSTFFYFLIIGVGGSAIGTLAFTNAFLLINPSLVILLQKLQPLVAITLAAFVLKEKIQKPFLFFALLSLVGGVLVSSPDILPGLSTFDFSFNFLSKKSLLGYGLTLLAVFFWGASTVFGKKLSAQGFDEIQIMGGRFLFGFIFMLFYLQGTLVNVFTSFELTSWGKVLIMVILSGLMGMYFYYKGLKLVSAKVCALAEMLFPLSAVVINWAFLDAKLLTVQLVGGAILIISSLIIQLKDY